MKLLLILLLCVCSFGQTRPRGSQIRNLTQVARGDGYFIESGAYIGSKGFFSNGGTQIHVRDLADHGIWVSNNEFHILTGLGNIQSFAPVGPDAPVIYFRRGGLGGQPGFGVPSWNTPIFKEVTSVGGWSEGSLGMNGNVAILTPSTVCPYEALLSVIAGKVSIIQILPRLGCNNQPSFPGQAMIVRDGTVGNGFNYMISNGVTAFPGFLIPGDLPGRKISFLGFSITGDSIEPGLYQVCVGSCE